jgi:3-methylcrotonyl-CoA carboxylase alpha subunit
VRIDTGVAAGDEISPHYDPMIAKLVVWGEDRTRALARMRAALADFEVSGLATNIAFLRRLVASTPFAAADLDTGLIERARSELFPPPTAVSRETLALAALAELANHETSARSRAAASVDPWSPWGRCDGWRLNQDNHHVLVFREGEQEHALTVHYRSRGYEIEIDGTRLPLAGTVNGSEVRAWLGDAALAATVVREGRRMEVFRGGERRTLELHDPMLHEVEAETRAGGVAAPMPGKVVAVLVSAGAAVAKGTPLVILEAMKMEHTLTAPAAGTVHEILFRPGEQVAEGAELIVFERNDDRAASAAPPPSRPFPYAGKG